MARLRLRWLPLFLLVAVAASACAGPTRSDVSSPPANESAAGAEDKEFTVSVELRFAGKSTVATLYRTPQRLYVSISGGPEIALENPAASGAHYDLATVAHGGNDHLLVTVEDGHHAWGWVLVPSADSFAVALEVQTDWGVTAEGDRVKVSGRRYKDGGGFSISSQYYQFNPETNTYEPVSAAGSDLPAPFDPSALRAVAQALDGANLPPQSYLLGFNHWGQPSLWGRLEREFADPTLDDVPWGLEKLTWSLMARSQELEMVWLEADPYLGEFAFNRRPVREDSLEPLVGGHSPLRWTIFDLYEPAVRWHLQELFGDRLLELTVAERSVDEVRVSAVIRRSETVPPAQEVPAAFAAIMGRLGSDLVRVGIMELRFRGPDGQEERFSESWVQFEWWRNAGMKPEEWQQYADKPIHSWDGALWPEWTAVGDQPAEPRWEQWAGEIKAQVPDATLLFLGWNDGGLMVALWVPAGEERMDAWQAQLEAAGRLFANPLVKDVRLASPGTASPRVARITRRRYEMLTRDFATGKPLPWSRLPVSQWPLLAEWYWDDDQLSD
ncbi:MAG TPA: hypothetical protein VIL07_02010 [Symbiobacteriaceae bacterium]